MKCIVDVLFLMVIEDKIKKIESHLYLILKEKNSKTVKKRSF